MSQGTPKSCDSLHIADSRLRVEDLQVYYFTNRGRIRAVDDISFEISGNESIGIVGESASGKSTLGAAIIRSVNPPGKIVRGKIYLNGINVLDLSESYFNREMRWKKIAVVFQGAMNSLDPVYRISEQLRELMQEHKVRGNFEQLTYQALMDVGLDKSVANRYPHELKRGDEAACCYCHGSPVTSPHTHCRRTYYCIRRTCAGANNEFAEEAQS